MNFHPDDFLGLISEVESQGGAHLRESCEPTHFRLRQPIDSTNLEGPYADRRVSTTGCKRSAKFLVSVLGGAYIDQRPPWEGATVTIGFHPESGKPVRRPATPQDFDFDDSKNPQTKLHDGTPALAKVCAIDDAMGLWPRFRSAMGSGHSFQEF